MNKNLAFVYWGGFLLEAVVYGEYQVEIAEDAIHVTFDGSTKCTVEDIDEGVYDVQNVQIEFDKEAQYEFIILNDDYIANKDRYQIAVKLGKAISIFWVK